MPLFMISGIILAAEITFVGLHADSSDDRSMYIFLPLFIYYLLIACRSWNPNIDDSDLGGISLAMYLMQFGIITVGNMVLQHIIIEMPWVSWGIYLLVLIIPTIFYMLIKQTKLAKILF